MRTQRRKIAQHKRKTKNGVTVVKAHSRKVKTKLYSGVTQKQLQDQKNNDDKFIETIGPPKHTVYTPFAPPGNGQYY